jgi:plastocyanin
MTGTRRSNTATVPRRMPGVSRTRSRIVAGSLVLLLLLVGCGGDDGPPRRDVTPTPLDLTTVGRISAAVTVRGRIPPPAELNMRSAAGCAAAHSGPVFDQSLVVKNGALANAVVWIKDGLGDRVFAIPEEPVVIDQTGCVYEPHVVGVMVGQALEFKNSDTEAHNVHGKPSIASRWNFMMSRQGSSRTTYMDKVEVAIPVGCDVHPWMRSYVAVLDHPYFAVTSADGKATLDQVPPGDYTLAIWHERLGTKEKAVHLAPKGVVSVRFEFEAP